jgi:hypothetical protein
LLASRSREGEYRHELQKAMELVNRLNEVRKQEEKRTEEQKIIRGEETRK